MPFNPEKFNKLVSSGSDQVRTGGKGSVRRKHKVVRKTAGADDQRLKNVLNKLNVRDIPAIEEVNLFKDDGTVIHFVNPKVQASIAANTYVVSGNAENKKLQDLLPGIITQLGPEHLGDLKKLFASVSGAAAGAEDDEVPELVENFEDVANKSS
jgi:nascent polypeptide-associated complex subunit beta